MEKSIYISEKLYNYINEIASNNKKEQMMVFGGKTIGDTILINDSSFIHFKSEKLISNDDDSVEVSLNEIMKSMKKNQQLGNDTFIMTHSHPCSSDFFEFMFGDLSDEDEINSEKLRELSNKFGLDYYDGITTGKKTYFWSTHNKNNAPQLLKCYVNNKSVDYNALTSITENIEHIFK